MQPTTVAVRDPRPSTPPEGPEVSGNVEIELDGTYFRLLLPSYDDDVEVYEIAAAEERLYWGARVWGRAAHHECKRVLATLRGDRIADLYRTLKERAVEKIRRGEVL